jgi:hypothetical protein
VINLGDGKDEQTVFVLFIQLSPSFVASMLMLKMMNEEDQVQECKVYNTFLWNGIHRMVSGR